MIVKVGIPTMTYADLVEILHGLLDDFDDMHTLDDVPVRLSGGDGLSMLRTIRIEDDHSDFIDGRDPHRIIVLDSDVPY